MPNPLLALFFYLAVVSLLALVFSSARRCNRAAAKSRRARPVTKPVRYKRARGQERKRDKNVGAANR